MINLAVNRRRLGEKLWRSPSCDFPICPRTWDPAPKTRPADNHLGDAVEFRWLICKNQPGQVRVLWLADIKINMGRAIESRKSTAMSINSQVEMNTNDTKVLAALPQYDEKERRKGKRRKKIAELVQKFPLRLGRSIIRKAVLRSAGAIVLRGGT